MTTTRVCCSLSVRSVLMGPLLFFPILFYLCRADDCSYSREDFKAEWRFDKEADQVIFSLSAKAGNEEFLTGVALGDKEKRMDFIGLYVKDGRIGVMDGYVSTDGVVREDKSQDVTERSLDFADGVATAEISRPIAASDRYDWDLSKCTVFHFPTKSTLSGDSDIDEKNLGKTKDVKVCNIAENCPLEEEDESTKQDEKREKKQGKKDNSKCSYKGSNFEVSWSYDDGAVIFDVEQKFQSGKHYSAIAMGEEKDLDVALIMLEDGKVSKVGDYKSNEDGELKLDDHQDFKVRKEKTSVKKSSKSTHIQFSRKLKTDDKEDQPLDGCVMLQFAINGGKYKSPTSFDKPKFKSDQQKACNIKEHCRAKRGHATEKSSDKSTTGTEDTEASSPPTTPEGTSESASRSSGDSDTTGATEATTAGDEAAKTASDGGGTVKPSTRGGGTNKATSDADETAKATSEGDGTDMTTSEGGSTAKPTRKGNKATKAAKDAGKAHGKTKVTTEGDGATKSSSDEATSTSDDEGQKDTTDKTTASSMTSDAESHSESSAFSESTDGSSSSPHRTTKEPADSGTSKGCPPGHQDLNICERYFDDYFSRIRTWAHGHHETMKAQYWKACSLLSKVAHVATLCCTLYAETCSDVTAP